MALTGYEVLGDFLANTAGNMRADRKQAEGEARQERLIREDRDYRAGQQIASEERANTRTVEAEHRAIINGLIAGGLLAPSDAENPTAVAAAFQKTTPEWRQEFEEKKQLRDEIAKATSAGVIDDVQIFSQDIDTLRAIAAGAREGIGKEANADRVLDRNYRQSIIDENKAQGGARINAQTRSDNQSYWIAEADRAAQDYDNAVLSPDELKIVQAAAAQTPGAEASPELFQAALAKGSEAALKVKRNAAYLRYQNAQRAAQIGAAIPKGGSAGNSVVGPAVSDEQKMRDFMKAGAPAPGGASIQPAGDNGGVAPAVVGGLSMLPLEKAVAAIPAISRFASIVPPVRAAVLGTQAGSMLDSAFPNNPAARVGRMFGGDLGDAMYGRLNFGPITEAERLSVRRPMAGSSVGNPYQ